MPSLPPGGRLGTGSALVQIGGRARRSPSLPIEQGRFFGGRPNTKDASSAVHGGVNTGVGGIVPDGRDPLRWHESVLLRR